MSQDQQILLTPLGPFRITILLLTLKSVRGILSGVVVKLVITPPCHGGGHGFKSRPSRHFATIKALALYGVGAFRFNLLDDLSSLSASTSFRSFTQVNNFNFNFSAIGLYVDSEVLETKELMIVCLLNVVKNNT